MQEPERVREQVARILESRGFRRSRRLSRLLGYLVEETLAGRADDLKELRLGIDVFDRGSGFDPRVDPIVRVEMRRLRKRLAEYYDAPEHRDELRIEVPTGTYRPRWEPPAGPAPPPRPGVRPWLGLAAALVALTVAAVVGGRAGPPAAVSATAAVDAGLIRASPFASDGVGAAYAELAASLPDDVAALLAEVPAPRVVAAPAAAEATLVLEGSLGVEEGRLRADTRLVDRRDGRVLHADSYERSLDEGLDSLRTELALDVAAGLLSALSRGEGGEAATASPEARRAYLRGMHHRNRRSPVELRRAVEWFGRATREDPGFAAAHAGESTAWFSIAVAGVERPAEAMRRARVAALRAADLQPDLALAQRSLGLVYAYYDWDWAASEKAFRRSFELDPGNGRNHAAYASVCLVPTRRFEEALGELGLAARLEPLSFNVLGSLGRTHHFAGRDGQALAALDESLSLAPRYYRGLLERGKVYLHLGDERAVRLLEEAWRASEEDPRAAAILSVAYARTGRLGEARELAAELDGRASRGYVPELSRAIAAMGLGDLDAAFTRLEAAFEDREPYVVFLATDPLYAPLRADARFGPLVDRLGLAGSPSRAPRSGRSGRGRAVGPRAKAEGANGGKP